MNKSLLVIVPSRNRIQLIKRMMESIYETKSKKTHVLICIDDDEPSMLEYMRLPYCISVHAEHHVSNIINNTWKNNGWYDYYSVSNDDFIYHTKKWDEKLISSQEENKPGVSYGDDLLQGDHLPTTSVIHHDIVRAAGWLQYPSLSRYFGDNVWKTIGQGLESLYYNNHVKIEHCHFLNGKREKEAFHETIYEEDRRRYVEWLAYRSHADIERIRHATQGN